MKLRNSLRAYVLAYILLTGTGLLTAFTYIAAQYFYIGMDASFTGTLVLAANVTDVPENGVVEVQGLRLSRHWHDQPETVRRHFETPPEQPYKLEKISYQDLPWERPQHLYYAGLIPVERGDDVFVTAYISRAMIDSVSPNVGYIEKLYIYMAIGIIAFATILVYLMLKTTRQVERLKAWAEKFKGNDSAIPAPKFKYAELNALANIVRDCVLEVRESVYREKKFLNYASHELRTPISTILANVELIDNLQGQIDSVYVNSIKRIARAAQTMKSLTETLLWLSRKQSEPSINQEINMQVLVERVCDSLGYLLKGKSVTVNLSTSSCRIMATEAAVNIVVNNIIQNAYQHTEEGHVTISQSGSKLVVENTNTAAIEPNDNDLGFGLGMRLTSEMTATFGWQYRNIPQSNGHRVEVDFQATRLSGR
tara:strand:+ start:13938 stop:15209 length:1272 start_codon:yes stop_codon:yes gene_type:complete